MVSEMRNDELLFSTCEKHVDNEISQIIIFDHDKEIGIVLAKALNNAIIDYSKSNKFSFISKVIEQLHMLVNKFNSDIEINIIFANALYNAAKTYGEINDLLSVKKMIDLLNVLADKFRDNKEVNLQLAEALYNSTFAHESGDFDSTLKIIEQLKELSNRFAKDREINLILAEALYNTANDYGKSGDFDSSRKMIDLLNVLAEKFTDDEEVNLILAEALYNAAVFYSESSDLDLVSEIVEQLEVLADKFPDEKEIGIVLAETLYNTATYYDESGNLNSVCKIIHKLHVLMNKFEDESIMNVQKIIIGEQEETVNETWMPIEINWQSVESDVQHEILSLMGNGPFEEQVILLSVSLPFYDKFRLYKLTSAARQLDNPLYFLYMSGYDPVLINWTNEPIYDLNEIAPVILNKNTVIPYVKFFFNFVRGSLGQFIIVEKPTDVSWLPETSQKEKEEVNSKLIPITYHGIDNNGFFSLTSTVIFRNALFKVDIKIAPQEMEIFDDNTGMFEDFIIGQIKLENEKLLCEELNVYM
jgi:tetratricopeptide (TPR) repeat protein